MDDRTCAVLEKVDVLQDLRWLSTASILTMRTYGVVIVSIEEYLPASKFCLTWVLFCTVFSGK